MKSMLWVSLVLAVAASIFSGCKKDKNSDNAYNISDSVFVLKASMNNATEIALGQIAADSATDPAVKDYGTLMVSEHTAAQQMLLNIASKLGMTVSNSLDAQHQLLRDSLLTLKGSAMDSVYIHSQVRDHQEAVRFFKNETAHGLQNEVKSYVYQEIRNIDMHLQQAILLSAKF
jgi:putative membrane protein